MKNLLNKIFNKIRVLYNYFRIELNLNFNIPYSFLLKEPIADKAIYISLFNQIKNQKYEVIDNFESACGYQIDKNWLDNLALHTQIVIKKSQLNYQHGRILYSCLRKYLKTNSNVNILETGTSKGFSSLCMSKAIEDSGGDGKIYTIDIIPHEKKMFWNGISDSYGEITRKDLLKPWSEYSKNITFLNGRVKKVLNKINLERINFAFLDAAHNLNAVRIEFSHVSSKQIEGDIIVFDDVTKNKFNEVYNFVKSLEKEKIYNISFIQSTVKRGYAIAKKL